MVFSFFLIVVSFTAEFLKPKPEFVFENYLQDVRAKYVAGSLYREKFVDGELKNFDTAKLVFNVPPSKCKYLLAVASPKLEIAINKYLKGAEQDSVRFYKIKKLNNIYYYKFCNHCRDTSKVANISITLKINKGSGNYNIDVYK
jgi:hypothetical protein